VPGQVQHAVEDEHFDFGEQVVPSGGGLEAGGLQRDGDVAARSGFGASGTRQRTPLRLQALGWKGKHVGGGVVVAELRIEALHFGVAGEQDVDFAGEPGGALGLVGKTRESEAAEVLRFSSF
jgi:hypothetical protein